MTRPAQRERRALADLFSAVGPDAPTLCEGWRTADLAAHLVVRERRPDAALGLVVPPLSGQLERVQRQVRDRRAWPDLVATVRSGPPLLLRPAFIDGPMNAAEFFTHHEDVRRAQPHWEPRDPGDDLERALWSRLKLMARVLRRSVRVGLVLEAPGYGRITVKAADPSVTVVGPPSELALVAFGRQGASAARFDGDPGAVEQVKAAALGL